MICCQKKLKNEPFEDQSCWQEAHLFHLAQFMYKTAHKQDSHICKFIMNSNTHKSPRASFPFNVNGIPSG
jgi:hypothetical protein